MNRDKMKTGSSLVTVHGSRFTLLKDRVDERRERRRLSEDEQGAQEQQHQDERQQPELLVLAQEHPDLGGERELTHGMRTPPLTLRTGARTARAPAGSPYARPSN